MIVLRQSDAEEYRRHSREQRSWMQRGHIFVLSPDDYYLTSPELKTVWPEKHSEEAYMAKMREIREWSAGKWVESHGTGWVIFYAIPDTTLAVEFKLRFF